MEQRPDTHVLEAVTSARDVARRARLLQQAKGMMRTADLLQAGFVALAVGVFLWAVLVYRREIPPVTWSIIIYAYLSLLSLDHLRMSFIERRLDALIQLLEGAHSLGRA